MIKLAHRTHILIYGFLWLTVGLVLLPMGLNFIVSSLLIENRAKAQPVLDFLAPMTGDRESAALVWIALMLAIGFLKARRIFAKSVQRSVLRLSSLPNPAPLSPLCPLFKLRSWSVSSFSPILTFQSRKNPIIEPGRIFKRPRSYCCFSNRWEVFQACLK